MDCKTVSVPLLGSGPFGFTDISLIGRVIFSAVEEFLEKNYNEDLDIKEVRILNDDPSTINVLEREFLSRYSLFGINLQQDGTL
jgi:hypothetical protein